MDKKRSHSDAAVSADPILRLVEASKYILMSVSSLAKRRMRGDPPDWLKIGSRLVGYRLSSLERFLADARRSSTSDTGEEA